MGRTVWCDKCRQPFSTAEDHQLITVSITPEGLYGGETFALDAHTDCVEQLVGELREVHEYGNSNSVPEISS